MSMFMKLKMRFLKTQIELWYLSIWYPTNLEIPFKYFATGYKSTKNSIFFFSMVKFSFYQIALFLHLVTECSIMSILIHSKATTEEQETWNLIFKVLWSALIFLSTGNMEWNPSEQQGMTNIFIYWCVENRTEYRRSSETFHIMYIWRWSA